MPEKRERLLVASSTYLRLKYSERRAPATGYPDRLAAHLTETVFERPGRLLDLGCGRGDFLEAFRRAGFDTVGADIHDDRHTEAVFADIDEPLPFADDEFDFVFSKSVVEHLSDALVALAEIRRVLRPGGRLAVLTPSWRHTGQEIFYSEYTHVRPFTKQSLAEALTLANFENVVVDYFWQLPLLWRSPVLRPLTLVPRLFRLPYRPLMEVGWPAPLNRAIRFSREVMLLGTAQKPG